MMAFCEHCHDTVSYDEKLVQKSKSIRGKEIKYLGKTAFCLECGNEIFVSEIRDYNLIELDKGFRESEKLISVEDIQKVIDKYRIKKRPLSLLLDWGENTVTRYLNGDIPTKQYSEILKRLLVDHEYFKELLEQNKENITSLTYKKCREALEAIESHNHLDINKNEETKIENVIKYLLEECEDITPLALQKLLYYSQAFNKIFNKEYLFNNDCEAWVHGPVFRDIYEKYKIYGFNPIEDKTKQSFLYNNVTEPEKELLNSIINNFGCYSGKILEKMTHIERPWLETRGDLKDDEVCSYIIDKNLIDSYFEEIKNKYRMINVSDIRDYSSDLFRKINH
ncbi:type II toxin-antitoxin system antitoxin SocA domain-containing protein [Paenibacillus illinoisensis]|uniref:type II toxin-antitoxin system antitoxin SocA domain-containing protein n=1 Tax=Paenibacillus illinoisensis TaxID=59845 RepID=UPI003D95340B